MTLSRAVSLDMFLGCMVGGVLGDCLGAPVEFRYPGRMPFGKVNEQWVLYDQHYDPDQVTLEYTDDTAMARQLANTIIKQGSLSSGLDARQLARAFVDEYYAEPHRGYGAGVLDVFRKLRDQQCAKPYGPAAEQFAGTGSYGNGAAMRVHPVALAFGFDRDGLPSDEAALFDAVRASARVTHAHPDGIRGALLQAYAVHLALRGEATEQFVARLCAMADGFYAEEASTSTYSYKQALATLRECLAQKDDTRAQTSLGNDVSALRAVPSAIYSFLRARDGPVEGLGCEDDSDGYQDNVFTRTLKLAVSFGGDTDTIASMAGAIAGAACGIDAVPERYQKLCECVEEAKEQGRKLYDLIYPTRREKMAIS